MEEYIGVIKMFGGDFAPEGYMLCQGQGLPIQQYAALFSIIGTRFGGDGVRTFQLPNLCGRTVKGVGTNTQGTQTVVLGESGGNESIVPITTTNIPPVTQIDTQFVGLNYIICVQGIYPPRP